MTSELILKKIWREHTMSIFQKSDETFEHIFQCPEGIICPEDLQNIQLINVADGTHGTKSSHKIGRYLMNPPMAKGVDAPPPPPPPNRFFQFLSGMGRIFSKLNF